MTASTIIINDVEPRRQYTATGGQVNFDFPLPFFNDTDLTVYLTPNGQAADDSADLLTITTNYTVTGAGTQDGGLVTLTAGATAGDIVTIERVVAIERTADYQNSGDLLAETLNEEQDTEIMISQQLRQDINRGLRFQVTSSVSEASVEDPVTGQILRWNALGNLENIPLSSVPDASTAEDIPFDNTSTGMTATDVQAAIDETFTESLQAVNDLSDVASASTAFDNIKQAATTTASGVSELAEKSEAQTRTDTTRALTADSIDRITPSAWVSFNSAGTIQDAENVTSITVNGTGDYAVTMTNALASANYAVAPHATDNSGSPTFAVSEDSRTTTVFKFYTYTAVGAAVARSFNCVLVQGEL